MNENESGIRVWLAVGAAFLLLIGVWITVFWIAGKNQPERIPLPPRAAPAGGNP
jgi:hypothetical protein